MQNIYLLRGLQLWEPLPRLYENAFVKLYDAMSLFMRLVRKITNLYFFNF